jgi:CheY-like chemotaxis protein
MTIVQCARSHARAESPGQAIALALEHRPDAVLLDRMMPKVSGFELRPGFHALAYTCYVPIFVGSDAAGNKYKEQCDSLGVADYFETPVDSKKLKERLAAVSWLQRVDLRFEHAPRRRFSGLARKPGNICKIEAYPFAKRSWS